jgi:hypothetical protein
MSWTSDLDQSLRDAEIEAAYEALYPTLAAEVADSIIADLFGATEADVEALCGLSDLAANIRYNFKDKRFESGDENGDLIDAFGVRDHRVAMATIDAATNRAVTEGSA